MNLKKSEIISKPLDLFKKVFAEFDTNGINYCVLRNFEFLHDSNFPWEGLDIVISAGDFKKADSFLLNNGFIKRKPQFSRQHKAYFKLVHGIKVSFDVQVGGVYWNDMKYLGESILANRVRKEFFYIPNDNDTFLMLLVHSILGKRRFKQKYQQILSSLLEQGKIDEQKIKSDLSSIFTKRKAQELFNLVKEKKFDAIPVYSLVSLFVFKNLHHVVTLSALTLRWICWKKPLMPAPLISIVGPDGAGKSTMVSSLHAYLKETRRKPVIIYMGRGRNHILPITILGRKYKSAEKKKDAQSKTSISSSASFRREILYFLSSFLFTADSLLRYWLVIFPLRMRKKIVITDRYGTDIILMKNVPLWWRKFLFSLFLKPTTSVLLFNIPGVLHQRRPEEPILELERQMGIFNTLKYDLRVETKSLEEDKRNVLDYVTTKLLINWY